MRALPDGTVELLSTHDQLLGGKSGQKYLGCVFPADSGYASAIAKAAMVIGRHLAGFGVLGRFGVDFVVVQDDSGAWTPYAIELNLRKGGTTHPFLTLQFLTRELRRRARSLCDPERQHQVLGRDRPPRG